MGAYDVLDTIHVHVFVIRSEPNSLERPEPVLRASTTMRGQGESDPRRWLEDCLVGLLEEL